MQVDPEAPNPSPQAPHGAQSEDPEQSSLQQSELFSSAISTEIIEGDGMVKIRKKKRAKKVIEEMGQAELDYGMGILAQSIHENIGVEGAEDGNPHEKSAEFDFISSDLLKKSTEFPEEKSFAIPEPPSNEPELNRIGATSIWDNNFVKKQEAEQLLIGRSEPAEKRDEIIGAVQKQEGRVENKEDFYSLFPSLQDNKIVQERDNKEEQLSQGKNVEPLLEKLSPITESKSELTQANVQESKVISGTAIEKEKSQLLSPEKENSPQVKQKPIFSSLVEPTIEYSPTSNKKKESIFNNDKFERQRPDKTNLFGPAIPASPSHSGIGQDEVPKAVIRPRGVFESWGPPSLQNQQHKISESSTELFNQYDHLLKKNQKITSLLNKPTPTQQILPTETTKPVRIPQPSPSQPQPTIIPTHLPKEPQPSRNLITSIMTKFTPKEASQAQVQNQPAPQIQNQNQQQNAPPKQPQQQQPSRPLPVLTEPQFPPPPKPNTYTTRPSNIRPSQITREQQEQGKGENGGGDGGNRGGGIWGFFERLGCVKR